METDTTHQTPAKESANEPLPLTTGSASPGPAVMLAISGCAILTSVAAMFSNEDGGQMMCFGMLAQAVGHTWSYIEARRKSRHNDLAQTRRAGD